MRIQRIENPFLHFNKWRKHACVRHVCTCYRDFKIYKRKNACSNTAFNSTDIRSVQDNVATPTGLLHSACYNVVPFFCRLFFRVPPPYYLPSSGVPPQFEKPGDATCFACVRHDAASSMPLAFKTLKSNVNLSI